MTTKRISALPSLSTVLDTTVFAVVDSGNTQKLAASVLKTYIGDPPSLINAGKTASLSSAGNFNVPGYIVINNSEGTHSGVLRINSNGNLNIDPTDGQVVIIPRDGDTSFSFDSQLFNPYTDSTLPDNNLNFNGPGVTDISSNNSLFLWTAGSDGYGTSAPLIGLQNATDGSGYVKIYSNWQNVDASAVFWDFDGAGNLTLPTGATGTTKFTRIKGGDSFLNMDVQYASPGNVYGGARVGTNSSIPFDIVTDFNSTAHTWRFDSNGYLTLPYGNNHIGAYSGPGLDIYSDATASLNGGETSNYVGLNWNNRQYIYADNNGAYIETNDGVSGNQEWTFTTGGGLLLPGGIDGPFISFPIGYIKQPSSGRWPLVMSGGETAEIRTNEDEYTFTFDTNGVLVLASPATIAGGAYNNAVKIATRNDIHTYTFDQNYWVALNGNALRINTSTGNSQYFACDVTLNVNGTYSVAVTNAGNSLAPGNWFMIPGTELGGLIGVPPAGNDLKITVATVNGGGAILTTTLLGTNGSKEWTFGTDGTITFPDGTIQQSAAFDGISVSTTETATKQKIATFSGTTGKTFTGSVSNADDWNWLSWADDLPFFTDLPNNGVRGGKISALVTIRGTQGGTDFDDYVEYVFSANYGPYDTNANCLLAGTNSTGNMTHFVAANSLGVWTRFNSTPATAQNFTVEITYTATLFFGQENNWC